MCKRSFEVFVIALIVAFFFFACSNSQSDHFDILIKNGKIVNGSGNPWFYGDVGIKNNTIVAIGDLICETAATIIYEVGLVVSP